MVNTRHSFPHSLFDAEPTPGELAQLYGFRRHQRVFSCPLPISPGPMDLADFELLEQD